ncbi:MAG: 6-phosphogluconolactonase [Nitrospiraceae bacterium]|nr:6-phosphogluconolactonase [Nitrospiraceae bacterium]
MILVFDEKSALEEYLVGKWMETARGAVSERGLFAAALSGGRTPAGFFRRLALAKDETLWRDTHIFMVDERIVPHDDKDSNWAMMNAALFENVPIPRGNIHPVPTDCRPGTCAVRYENDLKAFFRTRTAEGGAPVFDLVHLGIGEDGHTASLFPGSAALKEKRRLTAAVPDEKRHDRVTLTCPVLNSARNIVFLVTGEDKAEILERVIGGDPSLPASGINPQKGGRLLILADRAAASRLKTGAYALNPALSQGERE